MMFINKLKTKYRKFLLKRRLKGVSYKKLVNIVFKYPECKYCENAISAIPDENNPLILMHKCPCGKSNRVEEYGKQRN